MAWQLPRIVLVLSDMVHCMKRPSGIAHSGYSTVNWTKSAVKFLANCFGIHMRELGKLLLWKTHTIWCRKKKRNFVNLCKIIVCMFCFPLALYKHTHTHPSMNTHSQNNSIRVQLTTARLVLFHDIDFFLYPLLFSILSNRVAEKVHQLTGTRTAALWKRAWKHAKWLHGF